MNTNMKSNFWGASFEATPIGLTHIKLDNLPGIYTSSRPSTFVQNMIIGQMYVEHIGDMVTKYHDPVDGAPQDTDE